MTSTFPIRFALLLLLILPFLPQQATAQVDPAVDDSLRAMEDIRLEQKRLTQELDMLNEELSRLKTEEEGDEREDRMMKLEQQIATVEQRLGALEQSISGSGDADEWNDDGWDDWDEDEWSGEGQETDSEWAWWDSVTDSSDQYDIEDSFFKKYPGDFPWMFPMTTRLNESFLRYNRVEGFYLGFAQPKRLYWHSQPWLVSTASLGYGFANHTWRYSLGLYFPIYLEDQIIEIGGKGYSLTDSKDQWSFDRDENSLMAIVAREDFLDYFEREGFTVSAAWYYRGGDWMNARASVGYVHDTYGNMNRATNWSIFGGDKQFRPNPLINDGNINSLVIGGGISTLAGLDERTNGWDVQLQYEMAGGFAAGDFEFTQLILDVRRYQPLGEHLNLNLRARTGMSDGLVPQQRGFELGGPGTLPGYRFKEFAGSHVALLGAEFIVRSSIVGNARGWAKNVLHNTNIIFFANAGSTNGASPRHSQVLPSGDVIDVTDVSRGAYDVAMSDDFVLDNWKSDLGVALGSADGNFRIGAAWRLDRSEFSASRVPSDHRTQPTFNGPALRGAVFVCATGKRIPQSAGDTQLPASKTVRHDLLCARACRLCLARQSASYRG